MAKKERKDTVQVVVPFWSIERTVMVPVRQVWDEAEHRWVQDERRNRWVRDTWIWSEYDKEGGGTPYWKEADAQAAINRTDDPTAEVVEHAALRTREVNEGDLPYWVIGLLEDLLYRRFWDVKAKAWTVVC